MKSEMTWMMMAQINFHTTNGTLYSTYQSQRSATTNGLYIHRRAKIGTYALWIILVENLSSVLEQFRYWRPFRTVITANVSKIDCQS